MASASNAPSPQGPAEYPRHTTRQKASRFAHATLADPVEAALYLPEYLGKRGDRNTAYSLEPEWEAVLHRWLGVAWPCACRDEAANLWRQVVADLGDRGLAVGRFTYGGYSDADPGLTRAAWYAVLHSTPDVVVETGVARGVTSRFILEALGRAGAGRLWSVDLPHPFEPSLRDVTAAAVPESMRARWRYVRGSSRRRLPRLLHELGHVDVFVHDSLHTRRNVLFEMNQAASVLPVGGVMLIDDITTHQAFESFAVAHPDFKTMACRSDDGQGAFGAALRTR